MTKETKAASPLSLADAKVSSRRPPRPLLIPDVLMVLDRFKLVFTGFVLLRWSTTLANSVEENSVLVAVPKDNEVGMDLWIELQRI